MELLLEDMKEWLKAKSADEIVGTSCHAGECPISTWIKETKKGRYVYTWPSVLKGGYVVCFDEKGIGGSYILSYDLNALACIIDKNHKNQEMSAKQVIDIIDGKEQMTVLIGRII